MNYIAVDTASKIMKILVRVGDKREYFQCGDFKTASERLMPELDVCLKKCGARLSDMDFFACVTGPGSFTGIRIGMATVKAFAYACGKPTVSVTALELLAYNNHGEETVLAACDASNGIRYVAVYDDKMRELMPARSLTKEELTEFVGTIDEPYGIYADFVVASDLPSAICPENFEEAFIRAVEKNAGKLIPGGELEPLYIRKPQAERDLETRNGAQGG